MATVRRKISELTALSSASLDTTVLGVDNGTTYKIELDTLADAVTSRVNILDRNRLSALETYTSSFSASAPVGTISSSAQITSLGFISSSISLVSLNSYTSSQDGINIAFTNGISGRLTTSSFESFSSSVHSEILAATNEQSFNGLISGSSQLTSSFDQRYVVSGSITQTTWDNIANKPAGIVSQSTDLSSLNTFTASISTASLVNRLNAIESVSGSWITESETGSFLTNLNGAISSSVQVLGGSGVASGSYETTGRSIISSSAQITTLGFVSGSYLTSLSGAISSSSQLTSSFDTRYTLSGSVVSGTTPAGTISGSSQLTSSFDSRYVLETETGSLQTSITLLNSFTSSLNVWTSSVATTGSNSFNGNQTITGSLVVSAIAVVAGGINVPTGSILSLTTGSSISVDSSGAITGSLTGSVFGIGDVVVFSSSVNSRISNIVSTPTGTISGSSQLTSSFDTRYAISASFVSSSNLSSIRTITSASYAALTPVSGTLYIIIG